MQQYLFKCSFYQNTVGTVLKVVVPYYIADAVYELYEDSEVSTVQIVSRIARQAVIGFAIGLFYPVTIPWMFYRSYYILQTQHTK